MSTPTQIENLRPKFERILQAHQLSAQDLPRNDKKCHKSEPGKGAFQCADCNRFWSSNFSWVTFHLKNLEITYRWKMKCKQCYQECIPRFTVEQLERMFEKAVRRYKGERSSEVMVGYAPRARRTARPDPHFPDLCEKCGWGFERCWHRFQMM